MAEEDKAAEGEAAAAEGVEESASDDSTKINSAEMPGQTDETAEQSADLSAAASSAVKAAAVEATKAAATKSVEDAQKKAAAAAKAAEPNFHSDGKPNFGKMMKEKRETISHARGRGHPVDRRDRFEDGQPARGAYSVKEEVGALPYL